MQSRIPIQSLLVTVSVAIAAFVTVVAPRVAQASKYGWIEVTYSASYFYPFAWPAETPPEMSPFTWQDWNSWGGIRLRFERDANGDVATGAAVEVLAVYAESDVAYTQLPPTETCWRRYVASAQSSDLSWSGDPKVPPPQPHAVGTLQGDTISFGGASMSVEAHEYYYYEAPACPPDPPIVESRDLPLLDLVFTQGVPGDPGAIVDSELFTFPLDYGYWGETQMLLTEVPGSRVIVPPFLSAIEMPGLGAPGAIAVIVGLIGTFLIYPRGR